MINFKRLNTSYLEGGNLFLEMKLLKLETAKTQAGNAKISIYKGLEKLDETPIFNISPNSEIVIDQSILNFHIRSFEKQKNITFKISLEFLDSASQQSESFYIEANNFILPFLKDGVNTFARTDRFSNQAELQYMLFIEKTKSEVMKSIKSFEQSKQSYKEIGTVREWTITSAAVSEKQSKRVIPHENSQQIPNHHSPKKNKISNAPAFMTASQGEDLQKLSNLQISQRSNKVWYEMEDGQQKVNNLIHRRRSQNSPVSARSTMSLNLKIIGGVVVLGIIVYLLILLDDMNYGMDLVRNVIQDQLRSGNL